MNIELAQPPQTARQTTQVSDKRECLGDLLLHAAACQPTHGLRFVPDLQIHRRVEMPYPALLKYAQQMLAGLQAQGLKPGDKIALLLEQSGDFIPAFWACILGGYIPCPLVQIKNDPDRWEKYLNHVDQLLGHPALIIKTPSDLQTHGLSVIAVDGLRQANQMGVVQRVAAHRPAVFVLTSGSTGNAKAVVLSHANLLASLAGKTDRLQLTPADISCNWISFDHVAALIEGLLLPTYAGMTQVHVGAENILADPLSFLQLLQTHRATLSFTPNFLFGEINAALDRVKAPAPRFDLSRLRRIISGGEAVVVQTACHFLLQLEAHGLAASVITPGFGMTETCAGSIFSHEFPGGDIGSEFAALGKPIQGMEMRVVDEADHPLAEGEAGDLQVRGPMVFGGYFNNPEATQAAFTADGWFRTGDIGRIQHGRLHLVGRSKDSIIVNGANYFSQELEIAIGQLNGVEKLFVAAFPTRQHGADTEQLVVTFSPTFPVQDEARLHQLMIAIRNTTLLLWGFRPCLVLPLPREAFPKTSLGKIQRALLRRRLEDGSLAEYVNSTKEMTVRQCGEWVPVAGDTERAIAEIYGRMFDTPPDAIGATTSFFDMGGTSLDILKLKQGIERRFTGVSLPILAILTHPTVRALAACVIAGGAPNIAEYDPIVALQTSGDKTPLFCVHPGVGEVLVFVSLAQYFVNERPFYALRARGFNEGESYFTDFDEMVSTYVAAIRARQPHGPYAIAGYSYGGAVAFEIAKVLEAAGERVDFVGIFNLPPHIKHRMSEFDPVRGAVHLAFFLSLIDRKQADELPDKLRAGLPEQDFRAWLIRNAPAERLAELDLDLEKFTAWSKLAHSLTSMGSHYEPSGSVAALSVFYANPLYGTKDSWLNNELMRWDDFSRDSNRYIEVAGEHNTMLGSQHVASFQTALRAELARALHDG